MTVEYTLTPDDYVAFNLYLSKHDPALKKRILLLKIAGAAGIVLLGVLVGRFALHGKYFPSLLVFFALAALFVLYVNNQAKSSLTKQVELLLETAENTALGDKTLTLADTGLTLSSAAGTERFAPEAIGSVIRDKQHLFILTHDKQAIAVPLSAFESADDSQNFYDALLRLRAAEE